MKIICIPDYLKDNKVTTQKLSPQVKRAVLEYLKAFKDVAVAAGYPEDVVTGEMVMIPYLAFEDDEYCWTSSDIYHLEKYDIALEPEFVDKVLAAAKESSK